MRYYGASFVTREIEDIVIADLVLAVAFDLAFAPAGTSSIMYLYLFPIWLVASTLVFVLHELMHKFVAQHYGATAAFRKSNFGLIITLATSFLGFLVGLPGATVIYTNRFTRKEEGIVSLAGPLTNLAVFAVFFAANSILQPGASYVGMLFNAVITVGLWLAFFNMLPIYPLDGSKVLRWNKAVYAIVMIALFALVLNVFGFAILPSLVFVLVMALVMSLFYRQVLF